MSSILGIATGRISDQYVYQQMTSQLDAGLTQLTRLETELSTGDQFQLPSQDPVAAQQVISLTSLLAKKQQAQSNLTSAQSYLSEADSAMTNINNLMSQARATAVGAVGSTVTASQQQSAAQSIQQTIQQLIDAGNEQFENSYLFAGSDTQVQPFSAQGNSIKYSGNDQTLSTYTDVDQLSQTSVPGSQVFGALSQPVGAGVNLQPNVTFQTPLSDLHLGQGIDKGSIAISDGTHTSVVDLSGADTLGDVANLIRNNPPAGCSLDVQVTSQGLAIQLDPSSGSGNLSVTEVGGATTAHDLGIYDPTGVGNNPLVGSALDPELTLTTPLDDILGTQAQAVVPSSDGNSDIVLQAQTAGLQYNGATIALEGDPSVTAGQETVSYDPTTMAIVVHVDAGQTTTQQVVKALDDAHLAGTIPFTASLDPVSGAGAGSIPIAVTPAGQVAATTSGGSGQPLDQTSGLQIVNGGSTCNIDISQCNTVQDLLNTLNGAGAGVLAQINQAGTGIQVQSQLSGCDFSIGENGGSTATQLGLRTLSDDTPLSELNYGEGVSLAESTAGGSQTAQDFTITRADGVSMSIDLSGCQTVGDVLNCINSNAQNTPAVSGGPPALTAQLSPQGNGIELVDDSVGTGQLTITQASGSSAAVDLGLIPSGQMSQSTSTAGTAASVTVTSPGDNNALAFSSSSDTLGNGWKVVFQDTTNPASLDFDPVNKVMTFDIDAGATTANNVISMFDANAQAKADFSVSLSTSGGANDGTGVVADNTASPAVLSGGTPQTLTGSDPNPQEVDGLFTALSRIQDGLTTGNTQEINRGVSLLDTAVTQLNFVQADVGAKQQGLQTQATNLTNQTTQLQSNLSTTQSTDMTQVITALTAEQAAFQASLEATGQIFKLTLLNYI
jgi:flagellar hook-associated protein 3